MLMPAPFTCHAGLQYGEADEMPLLLDMLCSEPMPSAPCPAVIYIHGGGWEEGVRSAGLYPWLNPLLAAHGFITVSISYRLSRQSVFPAQIYDAKAAVRWLRANAERYHIDPERIGVWGDSAGGHLAALLGVTGDLPSLEGDCGSPGHSSRVQAVIARAVPTDFFGKGGLMINDADSPVTRLFGGTVNEHEELMRLASPLYHVKAGAPPFMLVHGTRDETVPFDQAERLYEALKDVGTEVTFIPIEGGHHNLLPEMEQPWQNKPWDELGWQALAFFQKYL